MRWENDNHILPAVYIPVIQGWELAHIYQRCKVALKVSLSISFKLYKGTAVSKEWIENFRTGLSIFAMSTLLQNSFQQFQHIHATLICPVVLNLALVNLECFQVTNFPSNQLE